MTSLRLYLDEDVRLSLADILRERGYDIVHVLEQGGSGKSDAEQLAYAVTQCRTLLTHNIRDFILLDRDYQERAIQHYGIIVADQLPLHELLRRTLQSLSHFSADALYNHVPWLSQRNF